VGGIKGKISVQASLGKMQHLIFKITRAQRAWRRIREYNEEEIVYKAKYSVCYMVEVLFPEILLFLI
jgi:hypothetical protein